MVAGEDDRARAAHPRQLALLRRAHVAFLALGMVSLVFGVAGGLARLSPLGIPATAVASHGALMVSAFFGTVISLERAAALGSKWAYAAPLAAGAGGLLLLAGAPAAAFACMTFAAAILLGASLRAFQRQRSSEMALLAAGALAWLVGNAAVLAALPAVPWWIAFFALTVGAERLELSRYAARPAWSRPVFHAIAAAVAVTPLEPRLLGLALVLLAAWLFAFDIARATVRQRGLARYVAVCLLAGYFWLAVGGVLIASSRYYDAALHAVFVGFVVSMVFGHAPVIVPALLRARFPYHWALYAPLVLLHGSLAVRWVDLRAGGWGNAVAIALFVAISAALAFTRASSVRPTPRAPVR